MKEEDEDVRKRQNEQARNSLYLSRRFLGSSEGSRGGTAPTADGGGSLGATVAEALWKTGADFAPRGRRKGDENPLSLFLEERCKAATAVPMVSPAAGKGAVSVSMEGL